MKISCLSVGSHAQRNMLPAIEQSASCDLIGVFTRRADVRSKVSTMFNCKNYPSEERLFTDNESDLVYISSPLSQHFRQAYEAIEAGKSILIEKTAFKNVSETQLILDLAKRKKVNVNEAFMYRFHSQFKYLLDLLKGDKYGKVLRSFHTFTFPHLPLPNIRYSKELCGGALYDAGAYTISSSLAIMGENVNLEWAKMNFSNQFDVDISGLAVLSKGSHLAALSWGFGLYYKNEIEIHFEKAILKIKRAYSKPADFCAEIIICTQAKEKILSSFMENHFVKMLDRIADDQNSLFQSQKHDLLYQAKVLEEIKKLGIRSNPELCGDLV